jgi:tetratricopeptide (TPR) repeat protein
MQYHCPNPDCKKSTPVDEEWAPANLKCPVCGATLASDQEQDELEEDIINTYPHLIALPFRRMHEKREIESKNKGLVDILTNVLKYLALLLETEYLRSDYRDEELNAIIKEKLRRPLVSAWNNFLKAAIPALEQADHDWFVKELPNSFRELEEFEGNKLKKASKVRLQDKGYYDENKNFVATDQPIPRLQALIHYRNKFAHGINPPRKKAIEEFEFHYALLKDLLKSIGWCREYPMYKRENGQTHLLMGAKVTVLEQPIPDREFETNLILGNPNASAYLSLVPLFVVPREHVEEVEEGEDLLVYDQNTGKRIVYVSPGGHHRELKSTFEHLRKLVEAKFVKLPLLDDDLNSDEISSRCSRVTRETQKSLRSSGKVIDGLYFHREEIEAELSAWPGTSFPLAVVTASSGGGKTCMLDYLASHWEKKGFPTFLVRAQHLEKTNFLESLRTLLCLGETVTSADLSSSGTVPDKPLLLVIDGINEHQCPGDLLASVVTLCKEAGDARRVKALLSYRDGQTDWAAIDEDDRPLFYDTKHESENSWSGKGKEVRRDKPPAFRIPPLTHQEIEECWEAFVSKNAERFKPCFTYAQAQSASRTTTNLLSTPLLLRLFLEVYQGQPLPRFLSRYALFAGYFDLLARRTGDDGAFLENFARLCLEKRQAILDLDLLYDDKRTKAQVSKTDVGSEYSILIREGVLIETSGTEGIMASFAAEIFQEYALGRVLVSDGRAGTPASLSEALEENQEFNLMPGACQNALHLRVKEEGKTFLTNFIHLNPLEQQDTAAPVLCQLVLESERPEQLVAEVFPALSENELLAASGTALLLKWELAFEKADEFLTQIEQQIGNSLEYSEELVDFLCMLQEIKHQCGKYDEALDCSEKVLGITLKALGPEHPSLESIYRNQGLTYNEKGEYDKAIDCHEKALELVLISYGAEHTGVATCYHNLGMAHKLKGQSEKAIEYYEKALAINLKVFGPDDSANGTTFNNLGAVYRQKGDYKKGIEYYNKALDIAKKIHGSKHPVIAISYNSLGLAYFDKREYEKAFSFLKKALKLFKETYRPDHPAVGNSYVSIGTVYCKNGEYDKGLEHLEKGLPIQQKTLGVNHHQIAHIYEHIGRAYLGKEEYDKAVERYEKALDINLKIHDPEHPSVLYCYNILGSAYHRKGEYDRAIEHYEKALDIQLKTGGPEHSGVSSSYNCIGNSYQSKGEYDRAIEHYEKALIINQKNENAKSPDVAMSYNQIGVCHNKVGNSDEAIASAEKALAINLKTLGPEHLKVAFNLNNIGLAYDNKRAYGKAIKHYKKALTIKLKTLGAEHFHIASSHHNIGEAYKNQEHYEKAVEHYEKALDINLKIHGTEHPSVPSGYHDIGMACRNNGEYDKANEYHEKALAINLKVLGPEHQAVARNYNSLGVTYDHKGEYGKAIGCYKKSLSIHQKTLGVRHPEVATNYWNIGLTYIQMKDKRSAKKSLLKAKAIFLKIHGSKHPRTMLVQNQIKELQFHP